MCFHNKLSNLIFSLFAAPNDTVKSLIPGSAHCRDAPETAPHFLLRCYAFTAELHVHLTFKYLQHLNFALLFLSPFALAPRFSHFRPAGRLIGKIDSGYAAALLLLFLLPLPCFVSCCSVCSLLGYVLGFCVRFRFPLCPHASLFVTT
ncbi:hypothetical protein BDV93DRAFT_177465 [Ceratobasidium sp. AG-I]|nr:hypothetical protein BDV93DRAFT_177465 [Ceratobasidium sp. AG-I]